MSNDRKKPTAGFWITVALAVVLVGYPLSFGPACWVMGRSIPVFPTAYAYLPLIVVANAAPHWIRKPVAHYSGVGSLGLGDGSMLFELHWMCIDRAADLGYPGIIPVPPPP
jgi:hypothetical protein